MMAINLDKINDDKLFQNHSKEKIKEWCKGLHYFYYMRARAGHNCEGDSFAAHFKYTDRADLIARLEQIGVSLKAIPEKAIIFDPFESYSLLDLDKIKYPIPEFTDLEQPQDVDARGHKVHIWVQRGRFEIAVSGTQSDNAYDVSDQDFEVCKQLETVFEKHHWKEVVDEEIKSHAHCISEEKYGELYE